MKRILKWAGIAFGVLIVGLGVFAAVLARAYDSSVSKVYEIPPMAVTRSTEPAILERGKHLAESVAQCASADCHGADLGGGKPMDIGPMGQIAGPNITPAGVAATYTDGELGRLVLHGVRKDGRTIRLMSVEEINWLPDADVAAIVSYVRSVPVVNKPSVETKLTLVAKIVDRLDIAPIDIARRIDHAKRTTAPSPAPTAEYGAFLARSCVSCHGEHFSGGPIPGAPSSFAVPRNITPHETGLKGWSFADFTKVAATGARPDGQKLDPFMPVETLNKMNDTEKQALWAYLQSLPPRPFGQR